MFKSKMKFMCILLIVSIYKKINIKIILEIDKRKKESECEIDCEIRLI